MNNHFLEFFIGEGGGRCEVSVISHRPPFPPSTKPLCQQLFLALSWGFRQFFILKNRVPGKSPGTHSWMTWETPRNGFWEISRNVFLGWQCLMPVISQGLPSDKLCLSCGWVGVLKICLFFLMKMRRCEITSFSHRPLGTVWNNRRFPPPAVGKPCYFTPLGRCEIT